MKSRVCRTLRGPWVFSYCFISFLMFLNYELDKLFVYLFCLVFLVTPEVLLLALSSWWAWGPYAMLRIEPRSVACKQAPYHCSVTLGLDRFWDWQPYIPVCHEGPSNWISRKGGHKRELLAQEQGYIQGDTVWRSTSLGFLVLNRSLLQPTNIRNPSW